MSDTSENTLASETSLKQGGPKSTKDKFADKCRSNLWIPSLVSGGFATLVAGTLGFFGNEYLSGNNKVINQATEGLNQIHYDDFGCTLPILPYAVNVDAEGSLSSNFEDIEQGNISGSIGDQYQLSIQPAENALDVFNAMAEQYINCRNLMSEIEQATIENDSEMISPS